MTTTFVFNNPTDLDRLHDLIHDSWFAVSRIRFEGRDLVIPFASRLTSRARGAVFDSTLTIRHVDAYEVLDTEKVEI